MMMVIGFSAEVTQNVTERRSAMVNVYPQILEGTLKRDLPVFATTVDMSARGEVLL